MQLRPLLTLGLWMTTFVASQARILPERHSSWTIGQIVNTQSGPVRGHAASSASEVSVYLGIPYARPPIGDLRFAPPQKYTGKTIIDGTNFGYSCPFINPFGGGTTANTTGKNLTAAGYAAFDSLVEVGDTISEDCLTLNIWTKPQVGEQQKAVMVWIYGGGFQEGTTSDPKYDGQFIADQEDVIIVSFNYRLNIFGFPGNPSGSLNPGLLDQRLAIEWVRDNIASFGGDPARITLFGQSAGSESIDLYRYAYTSDPIVSGLILESGTTALGVYTLEETASSWYNVTTALGCGNDASNQNALLNCMRSKSTQEITAAIPQSNSALGSAAFWPTVDNTTVFPSYSSRTFIHKPMLIGNNDNEALYFEAMASLYNTYLLSSDWAAFNTYVFSCPAAQKANASSAAGVPTWRYRYFGDFEDMRLVTGDESTYHGAEILMIFGTLPNGATEREMQVGRYIRGAWAAFAKDPEEGLSCYGGGWPVYESGEETLVRLAFNDTVGPNLGDSEVYDSVCQ